MALGPGKYDDLCTIIREGAGARMAIVIIVDGRRGTGFSMQTIDPPLILKTPEFLRTVADEIEADVKGGTK